MKQDKKTSLGKAHENTAIDRRSYARNQTIFAVTEKGKRMDLIDRQTIIAEFEWCKEQSIDKDKWQEAIDRIKALPAANTDMNAYSDKLWHIAYERGKAEAQRWIPVTERLPKEKGDYLVTFQLCNIFPVEVCYYNGLDWDKCGYEKVLAWQPLPEPYKDGD